MGLSFMEKQVLEEKVKKHLDLYGYSSERDTYVDIVDFVRSHGFIVGNAKLDDNEDGFLAIRPKKAQNKDAKIIGVNFSRDLALKRFIIAHEFAHSVLHYNEGEVFLHRENKKGKNEEENDADYFAAALLMPKDSFVRMYTQLKTEGLTPSAICTKLALIYNVPLESAVRRIDEVCA